MINVGAAMQWLRWAKSRSAIGQTNLPVQAWDQMNCACGAFDCQL